MVRSKPRKPLVVRPAVKPTIQKPTIHKPTSQKKSLAKSLISPTVRPKQAAKTNPSVVKAPANVVVPERPVFRQLGPRPVMRPSVPADTAADIAVSPKSVPASNVVGSELGSSSPTTRPASPAVVRSNSPFAPASSVSSRNTTGAESSAIAKSSGIAMNPDTTASDIEIESEALYSFEYTVVKGDTCASICDKFLNDKKACDELLALNNAKDAGELFKPGTVIRLPGTLREDAISAISKAREAMTEANLVKADQWARTEFTIGIKTLSEANRFIKEASYDLAITRGVISGRMFERAVGAADENAKEKTPVLVRKVFGECMYSRDSGETFQVARAGQSLPDPVLIRTGKRSRAELKLPDGSRVVLMDDSIVVIDKLNRDQRDDKRENFFRVPTGECMLSFSEEVLNNGSLLGISGLVLVEGANAVMRYKKVNERVILCTYKKDVALKNGEEIIRIPEGEGVSMIDGKETARSRLVPPPKLLYLPDNALTANQTPVFRWQSLRSQRVSKFRLEVSRDEQFIQIVDNVLTQFQQRKSDAYFPEGRYYWRLTQIDNLDFESAYSPVNSFRVKKNFDLAFDVLGATPKVNSEGRFVVSPEQEIMIRPAKDSSVVKMKVRIGDGPETDLTGPIKLNEIGDVPISITGIGVEGDRGNELTGVFQVDTAAPILNFRTIKREQLVDSTSILTVELSAEDSSGVDTLEYKTQAESFIPYTKPLELVLSDKPVELTFRATDKLGNVAEPLSVVLKRPSAP